MGFIEGDNPCKLDHNSNLQIDTLHIISHSEIRYNDEYVIFKIVTIYHHPF